MNSIKILVNKHPYMFSPIFAIIGLILSSIAHCEAQAFTEAQKKEIYELIHNETKKDVNSYLAKLDLHKAFKQTTGYRLETVLIIIVLVMMVPALLMNVIFCMCSTVVKSGAETTASCCKHGVKAACCCCQKLIPCG